ncbi:hypothetical protein [Candidatus Uabimicrobium sp. HlEnr_7]|uniref:hypothetical protein n=1 Tax=Candidatus Uabimicrobium helgolandensis TaxID=3095367 RepID=UPI0035570D97
MLKSQVNPFDTKALSLEKNFLPIREAYVGRDETSRENILITNILCNPGGCRFVVEGEIGVGKTSFVNYHRFLWENEAENQILTIEREISVYDHWNIKDFLINILATIVKRIQKLPQAKCILKQDNIFQEISLLGKVYKGQNQNFGINAFNIGFSTEKSENINVPRVPEIQLLEYFSHLVSIIKKLGFVGLFLHLDNLELIKNSNEIHKFKIYLKIYAILYKRQTYILLLSHTEVFFRM